MVDEVVATTTRDIFNAIEIDNQALIAIDDSATIESLYRGG